MFQTGASQLSPLSSQNHADRDAVRAADRANAAQPVGTIDDVALQLAEEYWTSDSRTPRSWNVAPGGTITVDVTALTAEGRQLARWALEAWSVATGLQFSEVASGADITFDDEDPGASAFSTTVGDTLTSVEINISTDWLVTNGTTIDSYALQTYIHEIGHGLGVGHPGDYDSSAVYGTDNRFQIDSWQVSVMSYFNQTDNTYITASHAYAVTPMIADILAIQSLYGAAAVHDGDTTYGANSTLGDYLGALFGQIYGEDPADPSIYAGDEVALTLYDTAGTDTLDFSPETADQTVDLTPEGISDVGGLTGNLIIARGTVIENVIGGSGADDVTGNSANNVMLGRDGDDTLSGGAGNDVLNGDRHDDTIRGGDDDDVLRGGTQEDSLYGDDGNDTLHGNAGFDMLDGGIGDDKLYGGDQADNLFGGEGDDLLDGGNGFDRLFGQSGNDTLYGGDSFDSLYGQQDDDRLYGQDGNDSFWGGMGNDFLDGGAGNDRMLGGAGFDLFLGSTGNDEMWGNFNADTFVFTMFGGGFGQDTIGDFEATNDFEKIDLSRIGAIADFADLSANHMTQQGADVVIDVDGTNTITLLGVSLGDLDANDFVF